MIFAEMMRRRSIVRVLAACACSATVMAALSSCRRTEVPVVAGAWSGLMMLEVARRTPVLVDVDVVFQQSQGRLGGRWRTKGAVEYRASGSVIGEIHEAPGRHQVDVRFTFDASPGHMRSLEESRCDGVGLAEGQLTYASTIGERVSPAQGPHWVMRLKAFKGIDFTGCSRIPYATWTLTRQRPT